jgi:Ni/Co efflux regulator RcnB
LTTNRILKAAVILSVAITAAAPAFAGKPDAPGNKETPKSSQGQPASSHARNDSEDSPVYCTEDRRNRIRSYYTKNPGSGNCPPGLAKKNNGCQPPGQIKKWRKGEPLPHDVVYHDLSGALAEQLGHTPGGDKIVQIDSDVLLISTATGMVLDAFDLQE